MNLLISEDGYTVKPDPKLFMITEFATLLDSRQDRGILLKELGYLWFMYNPESDFQDNTIEPLRHVDVVKYLGIDPSWRIDDELKNCIEAYKYLSTTSQSRMLATARKSISKLEEQIDKIDLDQRDKHDKPIWDIKKYQEVINNMPNTMASLQKIEDLYIKGKQEASRLKGDKEASIFEDFDDVE